MSTKIEKKSDRSQINSKMIKYVLMKNIMGLGIQEGEISFDFNTINVFQGKNGVGKSRALKAIQTGLNRELHAADILTRGKDEGFIMFTFDDGSKLEVDIKRKDDGKEKGTRKLFAPDGTPHDASRTDTWQQSRCQPR